MGKSPDPTGLFLYWENRRDHGLFSKAAEEKLCEILAATHMLATQAMYRLAVLILKNENAGTGILFPDEKTQTSERLNYLPKVTQQVIESGLISKILNSNSGNFSWAVSKVTS